jgi:beta-galactosidase
MKKLTFFLCLVGIGIFLSQSCTSPNLEQIADNRQRPFDNDWKFVKDSLTGVEKPDFDDSKWRTLDLPHDWSMEDLAGPQTIDQVGHFSKASPGGWATGYALGGIAWYRKHFTLDKEDNGKLVKILFDGVMVESDVWLNGKHLGYHPYGYTAFAYDLTPYLNPIGQSNVVAVRVKNSGKNSRWYSGSGIYRNVSLIVNNPVHIDLWGVNVTTPKVSKENATVNFAVKVINDSEKDADINVEVRLIGKDGIVAGQAEKAEKISSKGNIESLQTISIDNPELWSPESPNLYKVVVILVSNGKPVDSNIMKAGIRSVKFDTQNGLTINGQLVKLKGGCLHHDNGILGAAAFSRAEERKVEIMKSNGFNAIRSSHNPPSTKFLEACDSIGMFVIDEAFDTWTKPKNPQDYNLYFKEYWQKDMESMLLRDRNHPSVIIWSIGNEIAERADPDGLELTKQLTGVVKKFDTTRPTTEAFCAFFGNDHEWSYTTPAFALLDISGYNYTWSEWENDHKEYPERLMMTTESMPIDMFTIWSRIEKSPWIVGDFVWTGMDYLGESGIAHGRIGKEKVEYAQGFGDMGFGRVWPWFNAWCGDIDIIGNRKPQSYYRDVVWNRSLLEIAVHTPVSDNQKEIVSPWGWPSEIPCWTWPGEEGKTMQVSVYTRCTSVQLMLNGKMIGEEKVTTDQKVKEYSSIISIMKGVVPDLPLMVNFEVPYSSGELKAIGYLDGKEVTTKVLKTTGAPQKLVLTPDRKSIRADRNDLAYVSVEVADESGNLIPNAEVPVNFEISGAGELAAAGNGSPNQMASFQQPSFRTFRGKALIIVRPFVKSGKIILTAESNGMVSETVNIDVQ